MSGRKAKEKRRADSALHGAQQLSNLAGTHMVKLYDLMRVAFARQEATIELLEARGLINRAEWKARTDQIYAENLEKAKAGKE